MGFSTLDLCIILTAFLHGRSSVMYLDEYQRPLPGVQLSVFGPIHHGILAYLDGQQVILNTSLKHGRPVVSPVEEFDGVPVRLVRPLPKTWQDSTRYNRTLGI